MSFIQRSSSERAKGRRGRLRGRLAAVTTAAVIGSLLAPLPLAAAADGPDYSRKWSPPNTALPKTPSVAGQNAAPVPVPKPEHPVPPTWTPPKDSKAVPAGHTTVTLGSAPEAHPLGEGEKPQAGSEAKASGLPVTIAPLAGSSAAGQTIQVDVADSKASAAAGIPGVAVTLTRPGSGDDAPVRLGVDASNLDAAFGANWAARAHLVVLPECATTTPQSADCRKQTPLESHYDASTKKLVADIPLTGTGVAKSSTIPATKTATDGSGAARAVYADSTTTSTTVGVVSGASSGAGTYTATPLGASQSWTAGGSSGAFTYGYPVQVPPALVGSAPKVSLSYDSASVDGRTSSTNAQASWIGDGWDLASNFVERSFKSCSLDGITGSGDQCWGGANMAMSLAGHSGQLVPDDSSCQSGAPTAMEQSACTWRLKGDDGTKIQFLTGATNGTWNGSYIKVTDTTGTVYYFGLNHLPDANGNPTTLGTDSGSAWTVPVYSPNSGDPCYDPAKGQGSWCQSAWRWNLDFVVDPHGNLTTYTYTPETNYYSRGGAQNNGNGTSTAYTRAGVPATIGYGQLLSDQLNNNGAYNPAAKIVFNTSERCVTSTAACDPSQRAAANAGNWPDVPLDQQCDATSPCTVYGPTFWSTKWLASIVTQVKVNGSYQTVDSYTLNHTFINVQNATENTQVPWLASIQRTGQDTQATGGSITLPPVSFTPQLLANRVDGTSLVPAPPDYNRPRIQVITTETGSTIGVNYAAADCSRQNNNMPASADNDTRSCYNVKWNPPGSIIGSAPVDDWFLKYPVASITTNPATPGSIPMVTNYSYGKAAWHRNDSAATPDKNRTWDQFRGYASVTAVSGSGNDGPQSQKSTTYYQGMDGDVLANGSARTVPPVAGPMGGGNTDSDWLSGQVRESDTYAQAGGSIVAYSVNAPSGPVTTATHGQGSGLPDLTARYTSTTTSTTSRSLKADNTWRTVAKTTTTDPNHGNRFSTWIETADGLPDVCTRTNYAGTDSNPQAMALPSEVITVSGSNACTATPTAANTVSWTRTLYDGQALGRIGAVHDATSALTLDHFDTIGAAQFVATNSVYDGYGRTTSATDPNAIDSAHPSGATVTTTYTAAAPGELPTSVTTTSPAPAGASDAAAGRVATTTYDTARTLPLTVTDVNGRTTTGTYDALGRAVGVWLPGRDTKAGANRTFAYTLPGVVNGAAVPPTVTTSELQANPNQQVQDSYTVKIDIMDGEGRTVQSQSTPALSAYNGRLITDTVYDSQGRVTRANSPWYNDEAAPSTTPFKTLTEKVPAQTYNVYDGLGRPVTQQFVAYGVTQTTTTTAYPGADRIDVTPPTGATPTSAVTDARGHTAQLWQYKTATATGNPADADITSYTYTADGHLATQKDTAGNTWTHGYDLRGREVTATDPDTGLGTKTYDADGRLSTTTDARGQTLAYTYDLLGRTTGTYAGSVSPDHQLTGFTYDTVAKGKPATSTRYVNGASGITYTSSVLAYDTAYHPTKTTITIPGTEIGQGATPFTYTYQAKYDPTTGAVTKDSRSTVGDIAGETVNYTYDSNGPLSTFGGSVTYDLSSDWDAYGRNIRSTVNPWGTQIVVTNTYDESTGRPLQQFVDKQTAATGAVQQLTYTYNPAGQVTGIRNIPDNTPSSTDLQCFGYDYLSRLTNAWTDSGFLTQAAQPTVGGIGACANSTPTSGAQAPLRTTVAGPAAYWQSYGYDLTGNRTQLIQHDPSGDTTKDTTTNQTFPTPGTVNTPTTAANTGGGTGGAHALTGSTTTAPTGTTGTSAQYDAVGNTTTVTDTSGTATLLWNSENKLASYTKTGTAGLTTYLYDAGGNQLIRRDPGKTTINLGGDELVYDTTVTPATVTGIRSYQIPGGITLVRQGGNSTYQIADSHGTGTFALDGTTLTETRRPSDPFGNPRGTQPTTWAGDHGFVGGTKDDATGLTNLGAREYQPTTGRFLSPDPLIDLTSPQQWNAYAYSNNNPANLADPSGLRPDGTCGGTAACRTPDGHNVDEAWGLQDGGWTVEISKSVLAFLPGGIGFPEIPDYQKVLKQTVKNLDNLFRDHTRFGHNAEEDATQYRAAALNACQVVAACDDTDVYNTLTEQRMSWEVVNFAAWGPGEKSSSSSGTRPQKVGGRSGSAPSGNRLFPCDSFPVQTLVLMADGTTKPIGDLQPGDIVTATDPQTGETAGKAITHKTVTPDDSRFTDLALAKANENGTLGTESKLTSTAHHPYWNDTTHRWMTAESLRPGDQLTTPDHRHVTVLASRTYDTQPQTADNLTVADIHTYYVVTDDTPILVHNTDGKDCRIDLEDGTFLHPDGSIRDEKGHYAGTTGAQPGANNEVTVWDHLETEGATVIRRETGVRVKGFPLRKYDGLVNIDGLWYGIETKGASAGRTPEQREFDDWLNTPGNTANTTSGIELHGVFDAWLPQDRPPA
ncbi:RHS repeat-associated core domain-containing protein [Kitasatospora sp. NPDC089509]|uniref:RHS repeat-associated core domain-containing protein n=1 Tax=Kitasatospora sp. NPDC089509 TaxID=3364079 RepID=UPI0037F892DE